MNGMRNSRTLTMAVAVVIASALVGGLFGGRVMAGQDSLSQHYEAFTKALAAIETTYVGEVDSERLVYGAIGGLLQTLDPHSSFMDPRSYAQLRQRQPARNVGLIFKCSCSKCIGGLTIGVQMVEPKTAKLTQFSRWRQIWRPKLFFCVSTNSKFVMTFNWSPDDIYLN